MESSCYCPYVRAFQYLVLTRSEMQLATFQNRYRSLTNVMTYLLMYLLRKYYVRLKMTKPASPKNTKNIAPLTSPSLYPQEVILKIILMYCSEVVILCWLRSDVCTVVWKLNREGLAFFICSNICICYRYLQVGMIINMSTI